MKVGIVGICNYCCYDYYHYYYYYYFYYHYFTDCHWCFGPGHELTLVHAARRWSSTARCCPISISWYRRRSTSGFLWQWAIWERCISGKSRRRLQTAETSILEGTYSCAFVYVFNFKCFILFCWIWISSCYINHWLPRKKSLCLVDFNQKQDCLHLQIGYTDAHFCFSDLDIRTLTEFNCFDTVGWVIWSVKTRPRYDL